MKHRFFSLVVVAGLALSAFAQQNPSSAPGQSSSSQAAPADQSAPSAHSQPEHEDFWAGDEPGSAWLILHPFASKQYVNRHVASVRDRVNELDELTTTNTKAIKDVDERSQRGVQLASEKTSLADQHANDAANKAQLANQTATALNTRLSSDTTIVDNIDQFKAGAQTEIRFRPGQTVLSKQAKDALDQIAAQVKDQHGYLLEVEGYSSGGGQTAIANSKKMADSVVRYLVLNHAIPAYRIYVIGVGSATSGEKVRGGRVEISMMKNDLGQLAKQ